MYNYKEEMKKDIIAEIEDTYSKEQIAERMEDRGSFAEDLNDELWIADSVTGNGSGSYTFNRYTAKEYVTDNMELCIEALREFCVEAETIAEKFLSEDWEYFDVTIRCYLLGSMIEEALDQIENEKAA